MVLHNLLNEEKEKNSFETNKYYLNQGDTIKLGRIQLNIRNIFINGKNNKSLETEIKEQININNINNNQNKNNNNQSKKICKICFLEENDLSEKSPLINPCKCSGGVKYIHLSCLHKWLKTKCIIKIEETQFCKKIIYKKIPCELCKSEYPDFIQLNNEIFSIWNFYDSPFENYIIFESKNEKNFYDENYNEDNIISLYICNISNKNKFFIGRSHDCQIRIKDNSISRFHAQIELKNNQIILSDCDSKFGTLVLIQGNSIQINNDFLNLQIGKNLLNFSLKYKKMIQCFKCSNVNRKRNKSFNYVNNNNFNFRSCYTIKEQNNDNDFSFNENNNKIIFDEITNENDLNSFLDPLNKNFEEKDYSIPNEDRIENVKVNEHFLSNFKISQGMIYK